MTDRRISPKRCAARNADGVDRLWEWELRTLTIWLISSAILVGIGAVPAQLVFQVAPPERATPSTPSEALSARATVQAQTSPRPIPKSQEVAASLEGFETYKLHLMARARSVGISEINVQALVPSLRFSFRAMQLDQAQRPVPSSSSAPLALTSYLREHVTSSLISRGQSRYYTHWPSLVRIYTLYGVDPATIMAIYGKETSYGLVTGNFDLLEVLATLAFEGRRRKMFEDEFLATLKLIESGTPRHRLKGSYAGATGYPQFMPSVALRLRADGDGDGNLDIWSNEVDAMASIANYLRDAGWKRGVPWGAEVRVPGNFNRTAVRPSEEALSCPAVFRRHSRWLPISEWIALGVTPLKLSLPSNELAALMEPEGPGGPAYLLTANYKAILAYNCSNFYAMSVALLSDAIARR